MPGRTLVVALGFGAGSVPFLVEPIEVRIVIRNPFLDGLPGWLDGLHRLDIEGRRWRAWEMDDSLPEAVEAEEELDLLAADDCADGLHGAFAARAFERVTTPNLEDEIAPEGANGRLLFQSARDAVSHARWAAKSNGGTITVYDPQGQLFKTIDLMPQVQDGDPFILPSC